MRANYLVVRDDNRALVIRDIGPWDRFATVTNCAEQVVAELQQRVGPYRCLLYYDSEGELTELLISAERTFAGYAPVNDDAH